LLAAAVLLGLCLAAARDAAAEGAPVRTASSTASRGAAAIDKAAEDGKYLFIFFWKENDEQARKMFGVFKSAVGNMGKTADSVAVQVTDPNEKLVVDKFDVSRAPMPLVLALAPNGAVTKALPVRFTEEQLREGFVSPCTARCMKALQDRKLVLLCVQNHQTQFRVAAWQGAQSFKADPRFTEATELVAVDPGDAREAAFLETLRVDPGTSQAVTVLLAPPGQPIARFTGAVSKDQIVAKVTSAQSGCCPGGKCGPGGCCPSGQSGSK
jgi:hypothetical protein